MDKKQITNNVYHKTQIASRA